MHSLAVGRQHRVQELQILAFCAQFLCVSDDGQILDLVKQLGVWEKLMRHFYELTRKKSRHFPPDSKRMREVVAQYVFIRAKISFPRSLGIQFFNRMLIRC